MATTPSTDDGLMQLGHSKDHRPDLAQFKLMAAVAEPSGLFLAGDVHPGNAADDPLVPPLVSPRPRRCWARPGCSMPATARWRPWRPGPRSPPAGDFYLTRLPLTGEVPAQFAAWVEAAVVGDRAAKLIEIRRGEERNSSAAAYEFERSQTAVVGEAEHTWTERVQIIRSEAAAQSQAAALDRRLEKAEAAVRGLTPPPGPGRTQFTTGWELEQAVAAVLAEHEVRGAVGGEPGSGKRPAGPSTWAAAAAARTAPRRREWSVRYQITAVRARRGGDRTTAWRGWAGRCR